MDRPWRVPLSDIAVDDELVAAAGGALASGWWSTGPRVARVRGRVRALRRRRVRGRGVERHGGAAPRRRSVRLRAGRRGRHAVADLRRRGERRAPPRRDAVLCDVGELDPSLDPADVEAALGPRTRAIVALHYGGVAVRHGRRTRDRRAPRAVVIEDAAHAPGATYRGRACGSLGDIGCFSFFSNKNLPIGEGGMVVTDDARARRARPAAALPRHDRAQLGSRARARDGLRRAGARVQLPARRDAGGDRARPARTPARRERRSGAPGRALPRAARRRRRVPAPQRPRPGGRTSAHHLAAVVLPPRLPPRRRPPLADAAAGSRRASTTRRSTRSPRTRSSPRARCRGPTSSARGCSRCRCSRT